MSAHGLSVVVVSPSGLVLPGEQWLSRRGQMTAQVTRERIRQIESKALRKMRQPSRQGVLMDYKNGVESAVIPDRKGMHRSG